MQKRHCVDLKVRFESCGIDLKKIAERAAHGVVNDNAGWPKFRAGGLDGGVKGLGIGGVAANGARLRNGGLQIGEPLLVASQHRHGVAASGEPAHQSRTSARPDADNQARRQTAFASFHARSACSRKSRRSFPKNSFPAIVKLGTPNTPALTASSTRASSSAPASLRPASTASASSKPDCRSTSSISVSSAKAACFTQTPSKTA